MAVANRKSGPITNRDASPRVINNPAAAGGAIKGFVGTLETVSGDDINSVYRFGKIPSNALLRNLALYCDDLGANTVADFGLYDTTANGGAVVSQALFASAVSLKDGALNGTDITHEAGDIANAEKRIWELLSLAADPCKEYDVCGTLTVAADAAGTITLKGAYAL